MTERSSTSGLTEDTSANTYTENPVGSHPHRHGRPASWVLVSVVIIAFIVGGFTVIEHWWVTFWVCAGIIVLAAPAGKLIGIMNDTVQIEEGPRRRAAISGPNSAADPGVRFD